VGGEAATPHALTMPDIFYLQGDEIAGRQLAINRQIEQRLIPFTTLCP
jgi:hypothetical protein